MKSKNFFLLALSALLNGSCMTTILVYNPTMATVPEHQNKGGTKAQAGITDDGFQLSISHALTNHTYITLDLSNIKGEIESDESWTDWNGTFHKDIKKNPYKIFSWQIEGGYFYSQTGKITYGIGLGAGASYVDSRFYEYTNEQPTAIPDFIGTLAKVSVNPFVSFHSAHIGLGLSGRFTYATRTGASKYPFTALFWEPAIIIKGGGKTVKAYVAYNINSCLYKNIYDKFRYRQMNLMLGLDVDPVKLFKKKNK